MRTGEVLNDDRADWREVWALFPGDVAYAWHGALLATTGADSLIAAGSGIRSQIIWAKGGLVLSRDDHHWQHELCSSAVKMRGKGRWGATGSRLPSDTEPTLSRMQKLCRIPRNQSTAYGARLDNPSPVHAIRGV